MSSDAQLLEEVETFLAATGMNASAFGHAVANEGKLVKRMRDGSSVTLRKADEIRAFMAAELASRNAAAQSAAAKRRPGRRAA